MNKRLGALLLACAMLCPLASCKNTTHSPAAEQFAPGGERILDVDVVVVGAGGAGMTAGIAAAQAGGKVVILEKTSACGGATLRSTDGVAAAKTEWQDGNGWIEGDRLDRSLSSAADAYPQLTGLTETVQKEYDSWETAGSKGYFDSVGLFVLDSMVSGECVGSLDLTETLVKNSAAAIDWLDDIGANLHAVTASGGSTARRLHRPVNEKGKIVPLGSYLVPLLEQSCIDNGVKLLYNAPVTEILMDGGRAVGVRAEGYIVNAKSVILATGGFGSDPETITALRPDLSGFAAVCAPGCTGDGVALAQAVGAAAVDMDRIQVHPTVDLPALVPIDESLRSGGGILVNQQGQRFCDELADDAAVSAAELEQPGGCAYLIVDQNMADNSVVLTDYIRAGYAVRGETCEDLAMSIGVPGDTLAKTLETWNAAVSTRSDAAFGRTSFAAALTTAPYYAVKVSPAILRTLGGVKIDSSAQVLTADGSPIPGLFACGEVTGGVHGANCPDGSSMAGCLVFGRIAGASAAARAE